MKCQNKKNQGGIMKNQANSKNIENDMIIDSSLIDNEIIDTGSDNDIDKNPDSTIVNKNEINVGDKVKQDDRFGKVFGESFKKKIKKENKKRKSETRKKIFFNKIKTITKLSSVFKFLDFALNIFSILLIIFSCIIMVKYLIQENVYMSLVSSFAILVSIYLNEKIS